MTIIQNLVVPNNENSPFRQEGEPIKYTLLSRYQEPLDDAALIARFSASILLVSGNILNLAANPLVEEIEEQVTQVDENGVESTITVTRTVVTPRVPSFLVNLVKRAIADKFFLTELARNAILSSVNFGLIVVDENFDSSLIPDSVIVAIIQLIVNDIELLKVLYGSN